MKSQAVFCPNCSAQIGADDINIKALVGKCAECNHIFELPIGNASSDGDGDELEPSRPSGVTLETGLNGELDIRRRWFQPMFFFLLFFCIVWDGFLFFWYWTALFGEVDAPDGMRWLAILFPVLHVAVGIALPYYVLAGFLNTTRITVDDEIVSIRHRPIPWWGNRDLTTAEIRSIELDYVYSSGGDHSSYQPYFSLSAHHIDGRQVSLVSSLKGKQASYIGYHIAKSLGVPFVTDEPVPRRAFWSRWMGKERDVK